MSEQDFLVRDTRLPGHFWADNEVLDFYGSQLGPHGFAAYMALCRNATNGTGECRISTRRIAKQLGMSAGGAFNALAIVLQLGLARQIDPGGPANPAIYVLADVKALLDPTMAQLKLAGRGAHTVSTTQVGAHTVSANAHHVNAGAHTVSGVLIPRARNKESKRLSSRLKTLGGENEKTSPSQFSQSDFDARDLRRMAEAFREAEKRPSSVGKLSDDRFFEWICQRAGITVERGLHLDKLQRAWPAPDQVYPVKTNVQSVQSMEEVHGRNR